MKQMSIIFFTIIRFQNNFVIVRIPSYRNLSHLMLWNWYIIFEHIFNDALYSEQKLKKCVVPLNLIAKQISYIFASKTTTGGEIN